MRAVVGILVLIVGISFPLGMMFWLNERIKRQPALRPRQVGLILAFNGIFPISLVTLGLGLISAAVWDALAFRLVLRLSGLAAIVLLVALGLNGLVTGRTGGEDDR